MHLVLAPGAETGSGSREKKREHAFDQENKSDWRKNTHFRPRIKVRFKKIIKKMTKKKARNQEFDHAIGQEKKF